MYGLSACRTLVLFLVEGITPFVHTMPVLDIDMDAACINLLDLGLIAKVGIAAGTVAVGGANLRNIAAFARGVTLTVANAASWCKQHVGAVCKYVHITKCASAVYNFIVKNASTCGRFAWEFGKAVAKCTFFIGKELFISLCMVAFIYLCIFLLIAGCVYLQKFFSIRKPAMVGVSRWASPDHRRVPRHVRQRQDLIRVTICQQSSRIDSVGRQYARAL